MGFEGKKREWKISKTAGAAGAATAAVIIAVIIIGPSLGIPVANQIADDDEGSWRARIVTLNATGISSIFATLNGEVTSMGNASSVEVYFLWGENAVSLTHETPRQTINSTGAFTAQIMGPFMIGNTYYFKAKGENSDPGALMSFYVP